VVPAIFRLIEIGEMLKALNADIRKSPGARARRVELVRSGIEALCVLLKKAGWDESEHPRGDDGRFGSGSGGESHEVTAEHKAALKAYTGADFQDINRELRGINKPSGKHDKVISALDDLLEKSGLSEKTVLYRGVGGGAAMAWKDKLKKGEIIEDPGFGSTTTSDGVAKHEKQFAAQSRIGITMVVTAPKGTKARDISKFSDAAGERETLLARGTKYKVTSWSEKTRTLKVTIL
jgi:hypothetical protein